MLSHFCFARIFLTFSLTQNDHFHSLPMIKKLISFVILQSMNDNGAIVLEDLPGKIIFCQNIEIPWAPKVPNQF